MGPRKKCKFNSDWTSLPTFSPWLEEVPSRPFDARCNFCHTIFSLSNMGIQALYSHMEGVKHKARLGRPLEEYFPLKKTALPETSQRSSSAVVEPELGAPELPAAASFSTIDRPALNPIQVPTVISKSTSIPNKINSYLSKDNVTSAEILWCLESVMTHRSQNSAATDVKLFKRMFPDSEIAKNMQLQYTKISYYCVYGLAPFFQNKLNQVITEVEFLVLGFDESLNKVIKKQQMDINVRFWNPVLNRVETRYLTSCFLGSTKAEDLVAAFLNAILPFKCSHKITQISMDGPNVNLKFHRLISTDLKLENPERADLLSIGSCGLHTMHNSFKAGFAATGWALIEFLRAGHNLFLNVPARRALYILHSGSNLFPLKFCAVRWLENDSVAERGIQVIPNLKKFVEGVKKDKNEPTCNSYKIVVKHLDDALLPAKLAFFQNVASLIQPFLRMFQADKPMAPFLYSFLLHFMYELLRPVVKYEKLEKIKESSKLIDIDLKEKENLIPTDQIQLCHEVKNCIRLSGTRSKSEISEFKKAVQSCYLALVKKLVNRSPLNYDLTRVISVFDPKVSTLSLAKKRFEKLASILVEKKIITGVEADRAEREYNDITGKEFSRNLLENYDAKKQNLDEFWLDLIKRFGAGDCLSLLKVLKIVLTLSHGNANVERGFSINKQCLDFNLTTESLVAKRCIYDSVLAVGGLEQVEITKSLLNSVRCAHSRYREALSNKQKEESEEAEQKKKRKAEILMTKELREKKRKIMKEALEEVEVIDDQLKELIRK